jgi:hypothetical protein
MPVEIACGRFTLLHVEDQPDDTLYTILIILRDAVMVFAFAMIALLAVSNKGRPLNTAVTILRGVWLDRDSSVSIETHYGLDGPGIQSRWRRDFPCFSRLALGPIQYVRGYYQGQNGRNVALITYPYLTPRSKTQ